MWRTSVITVSDRLFPGLTYYDRKREFYDIENEIQSSLPLQVALYFNLWIYPIWFFMILINLDEIYYYMTDVYGFLMITLILIISVLEVVRIYLGYSGNLAEKIPELVSFWLMSILIRFPLDMLLIFGIKHKSNPSEIIINGIMLLLLIMEIISCTVALKKTADHHAKKFYIAQLYGMNTTEI